MDGQGTDYSNVKPVTRRYIDKEERFKLNSDLLDGLVLHEGSARDALITKVESKFLKGFTREELLKSVGTRKHTQKNLTLAFAGLVRAEVFVSC